MLTNGAISDVQALGYDESDIAQGQRKAERQESKKRLWRLCRQELYLNGETVPFAIISWRYTLDRIEILGVQSSPLEFELRARYQIVVRGAIGPLEGLKLLIDTGAIPSMVDRRVAKKLAVVVQESEFVAFGQNTRVLTTVLPNIRLGPLNAEGVTAGVGDLSFLHGVDAIIGLDVLSRSSFSVDYDEQRLAFGPVVAREPSVRLDVTPPFLTVQLVISGRPFRFLVDTGSSRLILFERRVRDRLPPLPVHGELLLYHLSGTSRLHRVFLPPFDVGGSTIEHVEGFMSDAPVDSYPSGIDGVLGIRVLAWKGAEFDFERNRLTFR